MSVDYEAIDARRKAAANLVPMTDGNKARVTASLASAFHADPVMNWFVRQDERHDEALRDLIGNLVDQYIARGWAVAAADGSCATLWSRPGTMAASMNIMEQLGMLPRILRTCTFRGLPRVLKVMDTVEKNHPKSPDHFYLFMIGVHGDYQGQGLGSTILAKTLETVDAAKMPAYLESSSPKNLPLYERHGFKIMKELKFENGPSLWPMWREART